MCSLTSPSKEIRCFHLEKSKSDEPIQIPNAKYGIIHESGKIIVPAQYDYLDPITTGDSIFITTLNEKNGLIHQNGTILLQPTYAQINTMYDVEGMLEARLSDNIYRLIDFNGKSLTKTYQSINSTNDGFIVQDQGYYGLINNQFKNDELFILKLGKNYAKSYTKQCN